MLLVRKVGINLRETSGDNNEHKVTYSNTDYYKGIMKKLASYDYCKKKLHIVLTNAGKSFVDSYWESTNEISKQQYFKD